MELKTKSNAIKLDATRKKLIEEYIKLQEDYQKLYNKALVDKFTLFTDRYQEETDIDKLTEAQINKLDKASVTERKALIEKYPKHKVKYESDKYLIAPFYIGNAEEKKDTCINQIDTDIIKLINKRTEEEIKDYRDFIK